MNLWRKFKQYLASLRRTLRMKPERLQDERPLDDLISEPLDNAGPVDKAGAVKPKGQNV